MNDNPAVPGAATDPLDPCRDVLDRAFEYLDGELADLDCAKIQAHLAECVSCLQRLAEDEQLKRAIREGCPCESAPEKLRARILVQITEVSITSG